MEKARFLPFVLGFIGAILIRISFSVYNREQDGSSLMALGLMVFGGFLIALALRKFGNIKEIVKKCPTTLKRNKTVVAHHLNERGHVS